MPLNSPRNAITRQWEMLKLLPSTSGGLTAAELRSALEAQGYTVTKRTVERDLEALRDLFGISHDDEEPFRWRWLRGASTQLAALSVTDALTAQMLGRFLKPLLPGPLLQPMESLLAAADSKLASLTHHNHLAR
jgi:predicted DNA-binding transcriptional regulator YafY